mgnify:FL=1
MMRFCGKAPIVVCDRDAPGAFPVFRRRHGEACQADESRKAVCDGTYQDKLDSVIDLCETLRAVYALAGENPEVRNLINDALQRNEI